MVAVGVMPALGATFASEDEIEAMVDYTLAMQDGIGHEFAGAHQVHAAVYRLPWRPTVRVWRHSVRAEPDRRHMALWRIA